MGSHSTWMDTVGKLPDSSKLKGFSALSTLLTLSPTTSSWILLCSSPHYWWWSQLICLVYYTLLTSEFLMHFSYMSISSLCISFTIIWNAWLMCHGPECLARYIMLSWYATLPSYFKIPSSIPYRTMNWWTDEWMDRVTLLCSLTIFNGGGIKKKKKNSCI